MMGYYSAVVGVLAVVAFANASTGDNSLDSGERVVLVSPVLAPPQDSKIHSTVRARQFPILVLLAQRNPSEYAREPQAKSLQRNPKPIYVQKLEDQEPQDQATPESRRLNRQKRHLLKKHFGHSFGGYGGGGGCTTCQQQPVYYQAQPVYQQPQPVYHQPQPVYHQPAYQQPPQTIVVKVIKEQQYGHGGGGGGHYVQSNPCGQGGCGGGHYVQSSPCGQGGCGGGNYGGGSPCSSGNCGGGGGGGGSFSTATATATASAQSGSYGKK